MTATATATTNDPTLLWWERLPHAVGRLSPMAHLVLTDGSYVRAFPRGRWAPAVAFGLGLLIGFRPWESDYATFSYSVTLTAALVVIGVLGASFGVAAWIGWCLGDYVADTPLGNYSSSGRLICDLLLGVAMVFIPVVAQGLRSRTEQFTVRSLGAGARWAGWAAFALTAGVGVYVWQLSVPQLVRPLWVFNNQSPELPAIEPFQRDVGLTTNFEGVGFLDGLTSSSLFWYALLAGVARALLTEAALRRDPVAAQISAPAAPRVAPAGGAPTLAALTETMPEGAAAPPGPRSDLAPAVLKAGAAALVTALVLAGLTTSTRPDFNTSQWLGMFAAFAIAGVVRSVGLGFVPAYVRAVNRVPVVVRILVCALVAQAIAGDLIEDALVANDDDFSSLLVPLLVAVGIAALLLPGRRPTEIATAGAPA